MPARLLLLLALLVLAACATPPQTLELRRAPPPDLPPRVELADTPFYPQTRYQCGPAALATVLNRDRQRITPEALVGQVYVPQLKGSLQAEMVAAASRQGMLAIELDGRLDSLLRELAAGHPVLVLQNLGFSLWPFWHYAVIIGYDLPLQRLLLRSGQTRRMQRSFALFERTWDRAGRWALVITDPADPAVSAGQDAFVRAALRLERSVSPAGATAAWQEAVRRWPEAWLPWFALGNGLFAAGDPAGARQALERAVAVDPQRADGWNNLAWVLHRLGQAEAARAAIDRARALRPSDAEIEDSYRSIVGD